MLFTAIKRKIYAKTLCKKLLRPRVVRNFNSKHRKQSTLGRLLTVSALSFQLFLLLTPS